MFHLPVVWGRRTWRECCVDPSNEVKFLFNGNTLILFAFFFFFLQASSPGDENNSDANSLSSDMLSIILHEDSCSGSGSATSGSMGSGSNGCGTSASGTSNSGTSKSRTSASGASGSGTGLCHHIHGLNSKHLTYRIKLDSYWFVITFSLCIW